MLYNFKHKLNNLWRHPGFRKYLANTLWLFTEKVLKISIGSIIGILVARYLGPKQYGILSYVGAFVGLFAPLSKLGFDGILQRDIAKNETNINELINSSIVFKFLGSLILLFITSLYMYFTEKNIIYFYLSIILSMIYIFKSFEVLEFYYKAKVKAQYISVANLISIIIAALLKIVFIIGQFSLIFFALANLVETILATMILCIFFRKEPYILSISKVSIKKGISLLKESYPLLFSGFFALIYLNIDQVMIGKMLNSYEVGLYAAVVKISSLWYVIPMILGWSLQTAIVNAKKQNEELYYYRLQLLFNFTSIIAYILIFPITYFSHDIIYFLFGEKYMDASSVLSIHIFSSLFIFLNTARGLWILNEGYFNFALISNIGAGILNIILNYIWLPQYGIYGAAWATLISYSFSTLFSNLFFVPARKIFLMQLRALLFLDIFKLKRGIYGQ